MSVIYTKYQALRGGLGLGQAQELEKEAAQSATIRTDGWEMVAELDL